MKINQKNYPQLPLNKKWISWTLLIIFTAISLIVTSPSTTVATDSLEVNAKIPRSQKVLTASVERSDISTLELIEKGKILYEPAILIMRMIIIILRVSSSKNPILSRSD